MPYRGTDRNAYARAGQEGKTPAQKKKLYQKFKAENKNEFIIQQTKFFGSFPASHDSSPVYQPPKVKLPRKPNVPKSNLSESMKLKAINNSTEHRPPKVKYDYKQLILDDIREYRSSKIISNISNGLATVIMKTTRSRQMTNFQMNLVRSSVAFVTSEVLNKVLEKPLKILENIEMFIKVGKAVYKLILWFNEESKRYEVNQDSVQKISPISSGYRKFLRQNPKIKNAYKYQGNLDKMLGKKVKVIVDRPLGSRHPDREDLIYELNYGYIEDTFAYDGKEQDAYIIGENKPFIKFQGQVIAVIFRLNDIENKLVVAAIGKEFSRQEILYAVNFQEKFFEIELIM